MLSRAPHLPRVLVLVLALAVGLLVAPPAASASGASEKAFVDHVNSARAAKGLPKLVVSTRLASVARGWSATMASRSKLEHRPSLGAEVSRAVTKDWSRVGENVGYTTNGGRSAEKVLVDRVHAAFMDSAGHRDNILGSYNQVGVGVVVAGNGTMWVTVNFMQAPLGADAQKPAPAKPSGPPAPAFGGWEEASGRGSVWAPSAVAWSEHRTDLFAIDNNGKLRQRYDPNGSGWRPAAVWGDLGRPAGVALQGAPAVVSQAEGSLDVFARGSDRAVWHRWYRPGSGWSGWTSRGGVIGRSPAAASWGEGHVGVFVTDPGGKVYEGTLDGDRWSGWTRITSPVTSSPAVAAWAPGRYDLFARGSKGQLVHAYFRDGRWSGWESLGGILAGEGRPDAAAWDSGRLDVFVVGTTGRIHRKSFERSHGWDSSFTALSPVSGGFSSGTSVLSRRPGHLEVYGRRPAGTLWRAAGQ